MGDTRGYSAELTIFDNRNGEIVGTLNDIELDGDVIADGEIERIEEFTNLAISDYRETDDA